MADKKYDVPSGPSMHGESAARRQAIPELLFFASIGDVSRCKKIVATWKIDLSDPKCCDYDKRTPLHLSAAEGAYSIVQWLVEECKANINSIDRFKRTPLEDAVRGDHGIVAKFLAEAGGKLLNKEGELIDLNESPLSMNVRIFGEFDPDWEVDPATLNLGAKLGEGEFGIVYAAIWHGTPVAVKVLKDDSNVALGDFKTELNVLMKVHHPHCVQFFGAVTKKKPYMIITELMQGGSLADMLREAEFPNMRRAVELCMHMARGMNYLHGRSPQTVIHRDLKPANLMIGGFPLRDPQQRKLLFQDLGSVKIADFGLSKSMSMRKSRPLARKSPTETAVVPASGAAGKDGQVKETYKMTGETGSYRYMAPEVYRHEPYNSKVDVYSFSMIAFQLLEGYPPFWTMDPLQAARRASIEGLRPEWGFANRFGQKVPEACKKLVERCWSNSYDDRPDFEEVVGVLNQVLKGMPAPPPGGGGGGCCTVQ